MYGNGAMTGMMLIITAEILSVIQKDQQVENYGFSAAVAATATVTTAGLLAAAATIQVAGTAASDFVMFGKLISK